MDAGQIEMGHIRKDEGYVFMQSSDADPNAFRPLVIHFTRDPITHRPQGF